MKTIDSSVKNVLKKWNKCCLFIKGMLSSAKQKTCTGLGKVLGVSHDVLLNILANQYYEEMNHEFLIATVLQHASPHNRGYLIIDDTCIAKPYSRIMEGVGQLYSSLTRKPVKGYGHVVICWSNGEVTIPLYSKIWISKELRGNTPHETKLDVARELVSRFQHSIPFQYVLLDGLYASTDMMEFFQEQKINFFMRLPKNRLVATEKDGKAVRIGDNKAFKPKRNARSLTKKGYIKGNPYFITADKRRRRDGDYEVVYIVSNMQQVAKKAVAIYKGRWPIEKFFRTSKQTIGWGHCQSRSFEKQMTYTSFVFAAYAVLETVKYQRKLKSPEEAHRLLQDVKLLDFILPNDPSGQYFNLGA